MATVKFFDSPVAPSIADLYAERLDVASASRTDFVLGGMAGDEYMIVYSGQNFTYNASGVTGGDLKTLSVYHFDAAVGDYVLIQQTTGLKSDFGVIGDTFNISDPDKAADAAIAELFKGADSVTGSATADFFTPGAANDTVMSGAGSDTVAAGSGADIVDAGSGDDFIFGGQGKDTLTGGTGRDVFIYGAADDRLGAKHADVITDFVVKDDQFQLDRDLFDEIGAGKRLAKGAFVVGTAAQDADDRIVYDSGTGKLFYDADGDGRGKAVLIATIDDGLNLKASDFDIVG